MTCSLPSAPILVRFTFRLLMNLNAVFIFSTICILIFGCLLCFILTVSSGVVPMISNNCINFTPFGKSSLISLIAFCVGNFEFIHFVNVFFCVADHCGERIGGGGICGVEEAREGVKRFDCDISFFFL